MRWVCNPRSSPSRTSSTQSISCPLHISRPLPTGLEKRTFDFFRARTAPCISGYFPDPVWDRYVLQTSQHEPTIRYAVNALGALHEERLLRRTVNETCGDAPAISNGFPVLQYSKALHGLQSLLH